MKIKNSLAIMLLLGVASEHEQVKALEMQENKSETTQTASADKSLENKT